MKTYVIEFWNSPERVTLQATGVEQAAIVAAAEMIKKNTRCYIKSVLDEATGKQHFGLVRFSN
ncbi:hypothetical protein [Persicobacter psychrovividus]|uniref:DUF1902 domain-containing protein n=1 Tax=Persicobacter psychrovividus TaxID=387638 RepID=A0ABM7VIX0_9BACT|nr:hypothetical protein PEPS_31820 [Persicobacter psychrovividus]